MNRNALRGAALASMCAALGLTSCENALQIGAGGATSSGTATTTASTSTAATATTGTTTTVSGATTTSSGTAGGFCVLDTLATLDQCKLQ